MNNGHTHNNEDMDEISPQLNDLLRKNTVQAPDKYFEQLEKDILKKTIGKNIRKQKIISAPFRNFIFYAVSAAAAIVFVLFGIKYFNGNKTDTLSFDEQIAQLSGEQLHAIIAKNIDEFDAQMLIETNYVDSATVKEKLISEIHKPILSNETEQRNTLKSNKQDILNDEMMQNMSTGDILQLLNESSVQDIGF